MILLQIHFNKKWYLMTICAYGYFATFCINVFNLHWCEWLHKMAICQYLQLNNETLWHWDHHFVILSWLDGSSVHTQYMIMQTKAWCLGIDACHGDKSTVACMITLNYQQFLIAFPVLVCWPHGYAFICTHSQCSTHCWRGWFVAYNVQQLLYYLQI